MNAHCLAAEEELDHVNRQYAAEQPSAAMKGRGERPMTPAHQVRNLTPT